MLTRCTWVSSGWTAAWLARARSPRTFTGAFWLGCSCGCGCSQCFMPHPPSPPSHLPPDPVECADVVRVAGHPAPVECDDLWPEVPPGGCHTVIMFLPCMRACRGVVAWGRHGQYGTLPVCVMHLHASRSACDCGQGQQRRQQHTTAGSHPSAASACISISPAAWPGPAIRSSPGRA